MPRPASTMRSLGGTAPFNPKAEGGMMVGAMKTAPVVAAVLRKCRLPGFFADGDLLFICLDSTIVLPPWLMLYGTVMFSLIGVLSRCLRVISNLRAPVLLR